MRISARNQLKGTVKGIRSGEAIANVELDVAGHRGGRRGARALGGQRRHSRDQGLRRDARNGQLTRPAVTATAGTLPACGGAWSSSPCLRR